MNLFLSRLEDRIYSILLYLLDPLALKKEKDTVVLYDFGISFAIASLFVAASAGVSMITARKNRKSQERMAEKQMLQQRKEAAAIERAEKASLTPPAPKNQQLAIQNAPKRASSSSLAIRRKRGKGSLRVGSIGNYGARIV